MRKVEQMLSMRSGCITASQNQFRNKSMRMENFKKFYTLNSLFLILSGRPSRHISMRIGTGASTFGEGVTGNGHISIS